mgnify:CR=1 FL=1
MAKEDFRTFFPGIKIQLSDRLSVEVFPIGTKHLEKFSEQVGVIIGIIASENLEKTIDPLTQKETLDVAAIVKRAAPQIIKYCSTHALDLLQECCFFEPVQFPIRELPHYKLPPILAAFIDQSFGSGDKLRPWVEVVELALSRIAGQRVEIWETLSNYSHTLATASMTFSTNAAPDGPMQDGAGEKSHIGASAQPGLTPDSVPS